MADSEDARSGYDTPWQLARLLSSGALTPGSPGALAVQDALLSAERAEKVARARRPGQSTRRPGRDLPERRAAKAAAREEARRDEARQLREARNARRASDATRCEILLSTTARKTLAAALPARNAAYRHCLEQLRHAPTDGQHHQVRALSRREGDCLVYPRGHQSVRIFFRREGERVMVLALANKHDGSYDVALSRGVRSVDATGFAPLASDG